MSEGFISAEQARRLRIILQAARGGQPQRVAARAMGVTRSAMVAFLTRMLGRGGWPPNQEDIAALLALPILAEEDARKRSSSLPAGALRDSRTKAFSEERRALKSVIPSASAGPSLSDMEIHRRREEARRARAAHEAACLDEERRRHGLTRQTRVGPISGMQA